MLCHHSACLHVYMLTCTIYVLYLCCFMLYICICSATSRAADILLEKSFSFVLCCLGNGIGLGSRGFAGICCHFILWNTKTECLPRSSPRIIIMKMCDARFCCAIAIVAKDCGIWGIASFVYPQVNLTLSPSPTIPLFHPLSLVLSLGQGLSLQLCLTNSSLIDKLCACFGFCFCRNDITIK